jgi:hypothetical protein
LRVPAGALNPRRPFLFLYSKDAFSPGWITSCLLTNQTEQDKRYALLASNAGLAIEERSRTAADNSGKSIRITDYFLPGQNSYRKPRRTERDG